ncbi:hypothetical protein ACNKHU_10500 [Shigella flexneri]
MTMSSERGLKVSFTNLFLPQRKRRFCYNLESNIIISETIHPYHIIAKVAALCGLLALSGCPSKITSQMNISGF